jgi:TonB-linked SusC/RagA family outer membrane protein
MFAQATRAVTGVVSADDGETLPGARVQEKNTTNGTITDLDGNFSLTVNAGAVLEISYLGFETEEIKVGNQSVIDVELKTKTNMLNEVVAIGYGVQQRKLLTGATIQVKGDALVKQNTVSPLSGLQGLTPGVSIVKNNGKPGEGFKILIRGAGTMHDAAPLCIVDGQVGDLNALNPSDIESVDVLKDAASAAIYGARAANGVILVTTKQAQKGKTNISYDSYYGWQNIKNNAEITGAQDYLMLLQESGLLPDADMNIEKIPLLDKINSGEWNGTNWLDEMTRKDVPLQNHALNINKGTESSAFTFGFSYTSQQPVIAKPEKEVGSGFDRYTARLNSDHTLIKWKDRDLLKIGETLTLFFSDKKGLDQATGSTTWNDFRNAFKASPLFPAYDENGDFGEPVRINRDEINPLAKMYYNSSMKQSKNYSLAGNFYFQLEPLKDLKWKSNFGVKYSSWTYRAYIPAYDLNGTTEVRPRNSVSQQGGSGLGWQLENTLSYDFNIAAKHRFNALLGSTIERSGLGENFSGSNEDVEFSDFFHAYLSNAKTVEKGRTGVSGSAWGEGGIVSFFGRVNYDYQSKYLATLIMRADASSNFAQGHRWGYFPSVSAGWNITEEPFMESARSFLNFLKIRASWGENGNNRIPSFRYLGTMSLAASNNAAYYYFGDKTVPTTIGSFIEYQSNEELTWETSRQTNIGLDMMLAGNRLGVNFDAYQKKTVDWLVLVTAPGIQGTPGGKWVNGGDIMNKGLEIQLNWNDHIGDFRYGISANLGYNQNEVVKIANENEYIEGAEGVLGQSTGRFYRAEVGKPLAYFLGYRHDGIFQTQEEIDSYVHPETGEMIMPKAKPGDVRFRDLNKDGKITTDDREMLGDPNPDFNYGLNLNLEYKGFDLAVSGYGVAGNQIAKSYRVNSLPNTSNYTRDLLERWHGEGTSNWLPSINGTATNWQYVSDLYIEDGDFFRITNIALGFDFKKVFRSLPLQQLRLYVSGQNLFTFTGYSGLDPEVSVYTGAEGWARGIDLGNYPIAYSYMVGLSIKY